MGSLSDIRVRAGQPIRLEVEFEGEPSPNVAWTVKDKSYSGDDHAELTTKYGDLSHKTSIIIKSSLREDTGPYTCVS